MKRGQPMLARFQNDVVEPATIKVLQFLPKGKNMFLPLFVNFDPLRCSAINFLNFLPKSIFSQKKNRKNECTDIVRRKKQLCLSTSVTRWQDYLFTIWPFTGMKICPNLQIWSHCSHTYASAFGRSQY